MHNTLHDSSFVKIMYKDNQELERRRNAWLHFGTNAQSLYEWMSSLLRHNYNKSLDVGCGSGVLTRLLLDKGKVRDPSLCDLSRGILDAANALVPEATIIEADITDLPCADGSYDLVVACQVLHHVQDLVQAISELKRVTKDGGSTIITVSDYFIDEGLNGIHYEALERLGFPAKMRDKKKYLHWSYQTALKLIDAPTVFTHRFANAMVFTNAADAMDYYASAMMYRHSKGREDTQISQEKWDELYAYVQSKVEDCIAREGSFRVPGDVVVFHLLKAPVEARLDTYFTDHAIRMSKMTPLISDQRGIIDLYPRLLPLSMELVPQYYRGINVGLDNPIEALLPYKHMIVSAHGTTIKRAIREQKPYAELLAVDRKKAEQLCTIVNYDVFCGLQVALEDTQGKTCSKNVVAIAQALGCEATQESIIRYIMEAILHAYEGSRVSLMFEVPGTFGFSLMPSCDEQTLAIISEYLGDHHGICVDLSHLMTWKPDMDAVCALLDRFGKKIHMIHISSAGSDRDAFEKAYAMVHGNIPKWHVDGLDVMLPIDDQRMLDLVSLFRAKSDLRYEVCESRTYEACVQDYFPGMCTTISDRYAEELRLQAKLLGYTP